jgi:hypothetical protein
LYVGWALLPFIVASFALLGAVTVRWHLGLRRNAWKDGTAGDPAYVEFDPDEDDPTSGPGPTGKHDRPPS